MLIMITSGWGVYNDDVTIRGLHFSQFWRLGDWAARSAHSGDDEQPFRPIVITESGNHEHVLRLG